MSSEPLEAPVTVEPVVTESKLDEIDSSNGHMDKKPTDVEDQILEQPPPMKSDLPKTKKKRLTLQERLALATKTNDKKDSLPTPELSDVEKETINHNVKLDTSSPPIENRTDTPEIESTEMKVTESSENLKTLELENNKLRAEISKLKSNKVQQDLAKKDELIAQLMKEGEQLSIKELKLNDIIKKLRASNQSYEEVIADLSEKDVEHSEKLAEIDELLKVNKLDMSLLSEAIKDYNNLRAEGVQQKLEKATKDYEAKLKESALKSKELNDLRIQMDLLKESNKIELSGKDEIIKNLKMEVSNVKTMNSNEIIRLENRIENLIMETESTADVSDISSKDHQKLLKNFNNLQSEMLNSKSNWELIEINLNSKITDLTSKLETNRKDKLQMIKDIKVLQGKLSDANDDVASLKEKVDELQKVISAKDEIIEDLNLEKNHLNEILVKINHIYNGEKQSLSKQITELTESLNEKQSKSASNGYMDDISYNSNRSFEPSIYEFRNESAHSLVSDIDTLPFTENNTRDNSRDVSLVDNNFNSFQLINKLSNTVKTLKVELSSIKEENEQVNNEKDSLERDLLNNSKKIQEIDALTQKIQDLELKLQERDTKEDQLLEIIGEKEERLEELRNDVEDLKDLCKLQVQQIIEAQEKK